MLCSHLQLHVNIKWTELKCTEYLIIATGTSADDSLSINHFFFAIYSDFHCKIVKKRKTLSTGEDNVVVGYQDKRRDDFSTQSIHVYGSRIFFFTFT